MLSFSERGRGPALALLHGIGSDRSRWDPLVQLLEEDFRCISIDLPGHGESPPVGRDVASAVQGVQQVLQAVDAGAATIVGHSFGASVGLVHAALHAPRSVVAVDPGPLHLRHLAESLVPFADRLRGSDFDGAFAEWEQRWQPELVPGGVEFHARQETVLAYWAPLFDLDEVAARQALYTATLHSIRVPTLVCLAEPPTPEDEQILAGMATATVEVYRGRGHFLHLVDPLAFCGRLRRWCRDVDGQGPRPADR